MEEMMRAEVGAIVDIKIIIKTEAKAETMIIDTTIVNLTMADKIKETIIVDF